MKIFKSTKINKFVCQSFVIFIFIILAVSTGNCFAMREKEDTISNLSFSHDGKSVVFDRCQNEGCQIQVYNLETGELAAYQPPKGERWTMGKYSYDGKRIAFSVIPKKPEGGLDLGEMQIAVMDADGKNYKKVTTGPGAKLYPVFSHNGKKVLYARAARIREKGGTPAAQYDAWEVNLETGAQEQLTFFQYYYMSNLTYFPDDERFIYYGENPSIFEGAYADQSAFRDKLGEIGRQGKGIHYIVVMKGKELIPNPYKFPPKTRPERPLLSKDGSVLIYEKSLSAGKFFLYSPDGNHRVVCQAGSVGSAAISPNGENLGISVPTNIFIINNSDGKIYHTICVKKAKDWDEKVKKNPSWRLLPEQPLIIMNK
jgi:Tol biopolymer transport system component